MGFGRYRFRRSFGQVKAQFRGARPKFYPLFTGLLDTYAGAAAAYSLRRLSKIASSVVRVRRSSDNAEADFKAKEVSDGTLTDWVNTDVVKYSSDFSLDLDGFIVDAGDTALAGQTFEGESDVLKHTPSVSTSSGHRIRRLSTVTLNSIVSSKVLVYIPSSNTVANGVELRNAAGDLVASTSTTDEWVEIEATGTTGSGGSSGTLAIHATSGGSRSFTGNGTDAIYYKNVSLTVTSANGFVETWYDQSGNGNDAVQQVSGSQPKIVDAGVLVSGGLDFDGVDDHFDFSAGKPITSIDAASAFFVGSSDSSGNQCGINLSQSVSQRFYVPILNSGSFRFGYADSITAVTLASSNTSEHLFTGIAGTSTASGYYDGELKGTVSSGTGVSSGSGEIGSIGSVYRWDGRMREIIIYDSDQSANRVAIETDINDHYDIYA